MFIEFCPGHWSLICPCGIATDFPHRLIFQKDIFLCPACGQELILGILKKAAAALDALFLALEDCQGDWIIKPPIHSFSVDPSSPGLRSPQG